MAKQTEEQTGQFDEFHITSAIDTDLDSTTLVAKVDDISELEITGEIHDYSHYGDIWKSKLMSVLDAGSITIMLTDLPADTDQTTLKNAQTNRTKLIFAIQTTDGDATTPKKTIYRFQGFVETAKRSFPKTERHMFEVSIAISGQILEQDGNP